MRNRWKKRDWERRPNALTWAAFGRGLLHPWWRPTLLAIFIVVGVASVGSWITGEELPRWWRQIASFVPIVAAGFFFREAWVLSDPFPPKKNSEGNGESD